VIDHKNNRHDICNPSAIKDPAEISFTGKEFNGQDNNCQNTEKDNERSEKVVVKTSQNIPFIEGNE